MSLLVPLFVSVPGLFAPFVSAFIFAFIFVPGLSALSESVSTFTSAVPRLSTPSTLFMACFVFVFYDIFCLRLLCL